MKRQRLFRARTKKPLSHHRKIAYFFSSLLNMFFFSSDWRCDCCKSTEIEKKNKLLFIIFIDAHTFNGVKLLFALYSFQAFALFTCNFCTSNCCSFVLQRKEREEEKTHTFLVFLFRGVTIYST